MVGQFTQFNFLPASMFLTLSTQSFCVIPLSSYLLPQLVSYASHISKKAGNDHSFVEPWFYYFLYTKRQSLGPGSGPEVCGSSDTSDPVLEALAPFVIKKNMQQHRLDSRESKRQGHRLLSQAAGGTVKPNTWMQAMKESSTETD